MNLENKIGTLAETYAQLDPNTIQHSAEITNDRRSDRDLRNKWFWTADFAIYTHKDNRVYLNLATRENNLIFKNIEKAIEQLTKNENYIPEKEDIETVISSKNTLKTKLSDLKLKEHSDEDCYFEINTAKYNRTLNKAQRTFAERVYGQGDDFKKNMKMFKDNGINTTRIYVLNSDYAKDNVQKENAIALACGLVSFGGSSYFSADVKNVDNPDGSLRGVPKVAKGDNSKLNSSQSAWM